MKYRSWAGLVAFVTCAGAQAVIIDDFSQGNYSVVVSSSTPTAEAVSGGSTTFLAGGERDAMLQYSGGPLTIDANVSGGGVNFFNTGSQSSGVLSLQYDGQDGELTTDLVQTPGTGLGLNLSGSNAFLLDFRFVNGGLGNFMSVMISVTSSAGTFSNTSNIPEGSSILHSVAFSNFGATNFANVQRLDFRFTGPASTDFTLDMISTAVPEPATLLVMGGGLALAALKKRRKS